MPTRINQSSIVPPDEGNLTVSNHRRVFFYLCAFVGLGVGLPALEERLLGTVVCSSQQKEVCHNLYNQKYLLFENDMTQSKDSFLHVDDISVKN